MPRAMKTDHCTSLSPHPNRGTQCNYRISIYDLLLENVEYNNLDFFFRGKKSEDQVQNANVAEK